jgi:uncharacterized protein (DUF1778 family)
MPTTVQNKPKIENINFRVSAKEKRLIEKAVNISGRSLTEFATQALLDSANKVIENEAATTLSDRDRDRLFRLLDAERRPTRALVNAAKIHRKLIEE